MWWEISFSSQKRYTPFIHFQCSGYKKRRKCRIVAQSIGQLWQPFCICQEQRSLWRHRRATCSWRWSWSRSHCAGAKGAPRPWLTIDGRTNNNKAKAPEIIMTPAWQLGQRRNICLWRHNTTNIFSPGARSCHVARVELAFTCFHANETRTLFPLLTQCTMQRPRGRRLFFGRVQRATSPSNHQASS